MERNRFFELIEKRKFNKPDIGYRVVLYPHFEYNSSMSEDEKRVVGELNQPIEFDYIQSSSLSSSSEITEHPLVNGDFVADHMYKRPNSLSFSGIFSLNGARTTKFSYGGKDRLTNIEILFEKIKNEAIFVDIVTENRQNSNENRFLVRKNCILNQITWTEGQNSLGFSFSFEQVLTSTVFEPIPTPDDNELPSLTDAYYMSFADEILDVDELQRRLFTILKEIGLIDNYFLTTYVYEGGSQSDFYHSNGSDAPNFWQDYLTSVEQWIFLGPFSGFTMGTYWVEKSKYKQMLSEFNVEPFRTDGNGNISEYDKKRFTNLVEKIRKEFEAFSETIQGYKFISNVNQQCMANIDGHYYIFEAIRDNDTGDYKLDVIDGETQTKINSSSSILMKSKSLSSYIECNETNWLFKTANNSFRVYLMKKFVGIESIDIELENLLPYPIIQTPENIAQWLKDNSEIQKRNLKKQEEYYNDVIKEQEQDLSNYYILVTSQDMSQFNKKIDDIITNYIRK